MQGTTENVETDVSTSQSSVASMHNPAYPGTNHAVRRSMHAVWKTRRVTTISSVGTDAFIRVPGLHITMCLVQINAYTGN